MGGNVQPLRREQGVGAQHEGWFVVRSKQAAELTAFTRLQAQGFEVYMPRWYWHGPKNVLMAKPLFPAYLFVLNVLGRRWQPIRSTIGVKDMFIVGEAPVVVRPVVIDAIQRREQMALTKLGAERRGEACPFNPDDAVVVSIGDQFGELDGVFIESLDANRVTVLVKLLGRETVQTLHPARIKPRPDAAAV